MFICPFAVQAEDVEPRQQEKIAEAPLTMPEDGYNSLLIYVFYQGTLSWQGKKVSTKFNYEKIKKNIILSHTPPSKSSRTYFLDLTDLVFLVCSNKPNYASCLSELSDALVKYLKNIVFRFTTVRSSHSRLYR